MELKVIDTGSSGNCYILENADTALIIEAGISFKKVKKAINYYISKICGVIMSHSHSDHAGYINDYITSGIDIYVSIQDAYKLGIDVSKHNVWTFDEESNFKIGGFDVIIFPLVHDVDCYGFQIYHRDMGRLVFITDTQFSPYIFDDIEHWVIECNHSLSILNKRLEEGTINKHIYERVTNNHMSLERLLKLFKSNIMDNTRNIILTHGSDLNSHSEFFKAEVIKCTGKNTYVASKGLKIDLNIF